MSTVSPAQDFPACAGCGTPYRLPAWGRDYACGYCGRALKARARPAFSLVWLLCPLAAATVLAAGVRLASDRSPVRAADHRPVQPVREVRSVTLPPRLPELLQRRAAWLEQDLRLSPRHRVLLAVAAETALELSVLHQPTDPGLAERWRRAARRHAASLRDVAPELYLPLWQAIEEPQRAAWVRPGKGNLVDILPGAGEDRAYRVLVESSPGSVVTGTRSGPMMAGTVGQVRLLSGSIPPPRAVAAPLPTRAAIRAYTRAGNAPAGVLGPGWPGGSWSSDAGPNRPPASVVITPSVIPPSFAELKARAEAQPPSAAAIGRYARALESGAEAEVRALPLDQRRDALRARLRKAGRLYQKAAETARLRIDRAAFFCAAGDAYRRAEDRELQYAALRRAADEAPVSASVWRELQAASLRTDRVRESEQAWREARRWSLPVLRLNY